MSTLMDLSFALARKTNKGSPHLRNDRSRINVSSAQKRLATLVKAGYLARSCVTHEVNGTPLWTLVPNAETNAMSFIRPATGDVHTAIMRSRVAAGLAGKGYVTGRSPATLELWCGVTVQGSYRCTMCGEQTTGLALTSCRLGHGGYCTLVPAVQTVGGAFVIAHADVAYVATVDTMQRCLIWIDDGRPLAEQWDELLPLAKLANDRSLKVVVRPHGFDTGYSNVRKGWPTMGPRLTGMASLITRAGFKPARGGSFGHRYCID